ncbi:MAG: hypothetical protein H7Y11_13175, partial [Armatimonadetes bacterium]|nr:hypothetical protein [Anaerolineae bacterium]
MLCALFMAGCNLTNGAASSSDALPPSPTSVTMLRATAVPTLARVFRTVQALPTVPPVMVENTSTPEPDCDLDPTVATTRHTVNATLDYPARTVSVDHTVTYINRTGAPLTDFVLNIEPNRYPGAFTLYSLAQTTATTSLTPDFDLTGRRLFLQLPAEILPGCKLQLQLSFLVTIPQVGDGVQAFKGFFGYSERQLNLGHWLPTVALRAGEEWITRQAVFVGEQEVLTEADWDVTLTVNGASGALVIAAPGTQTQLDSNRWRYRFPGSRDFTVSMSEQFQVSSIEVEGGTTLEVYTFSDAKST